LLKVEEFINGSKIKTINLETIENGENENIYLNWKVWDDSRVSEDFVMSIYLQYVGYYGKYVFYNCGFKEGVSLNIIDEITKLKKYIYGINEIIFYPCFEWSQKGIFTHLFCNFLLSEKIHFSTKYALIAYMGSYYSIALCPIVTCWFYFAEGFGILHGDFEYNNNIFINPSINTIYSCVFIFFVASLISNIVVKWKHRFYEKGIVSLVIKEIFYGLYLTAFYSSVSFHLLSMIVVYFTGLTAKWETTKKRS